MPDSYRASKIAESRKGAYKLIAYPLLLSNATIWPCYLSIIHGILHLTYRRKYVYMCYGQKQTSRSKVSSPPETRHSQSSSRKSRRPSVFHLCFFRCPRFGSGQVRDGAQSSGRSPACQQQRDGFRFFPPFVLSSAGSPRKRRVGRFVATKARAPEETQTQFRDNDIPSETAVGRSFAKNSGSGTAHSGAFRLQGSRPQHRTGAGAREKKRS